MAGMCHSADIGISSPGIDIALRASGQQPALSLPFSAGRWAMGIHMCGDDHASVADHCTNPRHCEPFHWSPLVSVAWIVKPSSVRVSAAGSRAAARYGFAHP